VAPTPRRQSWLAGRNLSVGTALTLDLMDTFPLHAKLTIDVECIPLLVAGEREPTGTRSSRVVCLRLPSPSKLSEYYGGLLLAPLVPQ